MGIVTFALAVPSAAFAHHGHRHHHHRLRAKEHHAKFRLEHIGDGTTGTPAPPTGTQPATPESAGTVATYASGVLTLKLSDGSTVSGKVTSDTRIGCIKASTAPTAGTEVQPTDRDPGDDNGHGEDHGHGGMGQQDDRGSGSSNGSQQGSGWGSGEDHGEVPSASEPPCDTSLLIPGAKVRAAELRIGPGGGEFESVWLVR
jgi:hypothetical protein